MYCKILLNISVLVLFILVYLISFHISVFIKVLAGHVTQQCEKFQSEEHYTLKSAKDPTDLTATTEYIFNWSSRRPFRTRRLVKIYLLTINWHCKNTRCIETLTIDKYKKINKNRSTDRSNGFLSTRSKSHNYHANYYNDLVYQKCEFPQWLSNPKNRRSY